VIAATSHRSHPGSDNNIRSSSSSLHRNTVTSNVYACTPYTPSGAPISRTAAACTVLIHPHPACISYTHNSSSGSAPISRTAAACTVTPSNSAFTHHTSKQVVQLSTYQPDSSLHSGTPTSNEHTSGVHANQGVHPVSKRRTAAATPTDERLHRFFYYTLTFVITPINISL
jgi:hypothetical protein